CAGELRKAGPRLKLTGQPFQVLATLLERPGEVVTREQLQKRLWPDTFVDVDHNLNTAINKIRDALGDSAENPRFVETLSRRGYRFIAPVNDDGTGNHATPNTITNGAPNTVARQRMLAASILVVVALLGIAGLLIYNDRRLPTSQVRGALTGITFDEGLQS